MGGISPTTPSSTRVPFLELAYQMQSAASDAVDLTNESDATKKMYGMDNPASSVFGTNCLMARKLVERGVRFVELYSGAGSGWDAHNDLEGNHTKYCGSADKPIAGLLADLKARGMLKDTLVVWGGEFGRTPFQRADHRPRPQPVGLHDVDGRRRRQGRPVRRNHRRNRPARGGEAASTCTTFTPRSCG